ncbi:hypothetical protein [Marinithermus hydrothermalis]|uniref:Uncharacterized protein n=1 Tax=Marinithermus hydrothermalis (strain DSM 14884 / JCM 11576 / T1) TaxID=869210 RepID=F2NMG5_MARHT|nr:hypothetical protein [Marinithermus hydrothermalis]AEB12135.1 hypothetical protein Marky_1400 [Marinithermus hydrothermalis DSM 14884]
MKKIFPVILRLYSMLRKVHHICGTYCEGLRLRVRHGARAHRTFTVWNRALWRLTPLMVLALASCGQPSGGGQPPQPPVTGAPLPYAEREQAVTTVIAKIDELYGGRLDGRSVAELQQLADFMVSLPEFEAAGVADDHTVWGRFTDGRLYLVVDNRETNTMTGTGTNTAADPAALEPYAPARPALRPLQAGELELPKVRRALVMNALGTAFVSPSARIRGWLADAGYQASSPTPTVDLLKSVSGVGVFYLDAHGGEGQGRDGKTRYGIWTATPVSAAGELKYDDDLKTLRLVWMTALEDTLPDGTDTFETHYAFTGDFVSTYMSFSEHSLVFINACSSYTGAGMQSGFLAAGASVYAGWTKPVSDGAANLAANYFFDRALGSNRYLPETAAQRPFDYLAVWNEMKRKEYEVDYKGNPPTHEDPETRLVFVELQPAFALLAPSIERLAVDEIAGKLTLSGMFGAQSQADAKVSVDGLPLDVLSWSATEVVAKLPPGQDAGPVEVEVGRRRSNAVPLTRWQLRITYDAEMHLTDFLLFDSWDSRTTVTCTLTVRADVHPYRTAPGTSPTLPKNIPVHATQDSSCTWTETLSASSFDGACTVTVNDSGTIPWFDPSKTPPGLPGESSSDWFIFSATLDTETLTWNDVDLQFDAQATEHWDCFGEVSTETASIAVDELTLFTPLILEMDSNFVVIGDSLIDDSFVGGTITLSWEDAPPAFPPEENVTCASLACP